MEKFQTISVEELLIHAIPILEKYDKVLIGSVERDAIMSGQSDIFFQLGLTDPKLMAAGQKEFLNLFSGMKNDMRNLVGDFIRDGALNNADVARKLTSSYMKRFKSICGDYYNKMFLSGAKAVGNPYYRDLGQTRKDFAFLAKARRVEQRFFRKLLGDIGNPNHIPRHPYLTRGAYYGESGRAQFLNGMVGGAGKKVNVRWVMNMYGTPLTEHCDVCPVLAKGLYSWKTLPTIPRGGDTPCLFRCYCGLQIIPPKGPPRVTVPGRSTQEGQYAPNRYGTLYDANGEPILGTALANIERMYAEMYKARQMIQIKTGATRREWIMKRQAINRNLIDYIKARGYRTVPSVSVRALIETAKSAQAKGGSLTVFEKLGIGDELVFVRANYSAVGILEVRGNRLVFVGSDGQVLAVDDATDILFVTKKARIIDEGIPRRDIIKSLNECADHTAMTNKEFGVCLNSKGDVIWKKAGTGDEILMTAGDVVEMQNQPIFIHSHNEDWPFSMSDIMFASQNKIGKMLVVTNKYVFELTPKNMWPRASGYTEIEMARFYDRQYMMTPRGTSQTKSMHLAMKALAKEYNLKYERFTRQSYYGKVGT